MELRNNLQTTTGWEIIETGFDPQQIVATGSNLMIGNGYLGYRGTFAEWEADQFVACIVTDTYDRAEGGRLRELCNVPNALFTQLFVDDDLLTATEDQISGYQRGLDLRYGRYHRTMHWQSSQGVAVALRTERFASLDNHHLIAMRYRFEADKDTQLVLITGIDGRVWSLNGEHLQDYHLIETEGTIAIETTTVEFGIKIDVVEGLHITGSEPVENDIVREDRRILRRIVFDVAAGQLIEIQKLVGIYTSNDVDDPFDTAVDGVLQAVAGGYEALEVKHQKRWDTIWRDVDIQIEGNLEDQVITRFNLYHNIIHTPTHARLPIGARGLSCQVYQGAAFWDQEIFNLPMFIYTWPAVARNILAYRYDTLDGARAKARRLGYQGAYYAWTSGKTGKELFPDYFFIDVLSGRKLHNHFNSWQIHISPDIVYAIWQYYQATGDQDFIVQYGAEIAFEVARFIVSRIHLKKDKNRYELLRVIGPDEYHEGVDNNAFTNYQARLALSVALECHQMLQAHAPDQLRALMARLELGEEAVGDWQDIVDRIYLPQPDEETHLIEQFDGYFQLEDTRPDVIRQRLKHPEEYWGWPIGIAVETQVIKQGDVVQLLALHDDFPYEVIQANFDYYEVRTEHGSSLSPSVHALVAAKAGYNDRAYAYFRESATIDLYATSKKVMSGGSFLGGIHTAACGATWQIIVQGFAGLKVEQDCLILQPALPTSWTSLGFRVYYRSNLLTLTITRTSVAVESVVGNREAITVQVGAASNVLQPGDEAHFTL